MKCLYIEDGKYIIRDRGYVFIAEEEGIILDQDTPYALGELVDWCVEQGLEPGVDFIVGRRYGTTINRTWWFKSSAYQTLFSIKWG